MAQHRRLGSDDGTILSACATCGFRFRSSEMRMCSDNVVRCTAAGNNCAGGDNLLDYNRKRASLKLKTDDQSNIPLGTPSSWVP